MCDRIPGAWYDISTRVSACRAVASAAMETLPGGELARPVMDRVNETGNLISAIIDLLQMVEKDVERLEQQLKCPH